MFVLTPDGSPQEYPSPELPTGEVFYVRSLFLHLEAPSWFFILKNKLNRPLFDKECYKGLIGDFCVVGWDGNG